MRAFIPLSEVYPSFARLAWWPTSAEPYYYPLRQAGYRFQPATECTIAGWVLDRPGETISKS